jgi:hypothetical protein
MAKKRTKTREISTKDSLEMRVRVKLPPGHILAEKLLDFTRMGEYLAQVNRGVAIIKSVGLDCDFFSADMDHVIDMILGDTLNAARKSGDLEEIKKLHNKMNAIQALHEARKGVQKGQLDSMRFSSENLMEFEGVLVKAEGDFLFVRPFKNRPWPMFHIRMGWVKFPVIKNNHSENLFSEPIHKSHVRPPRGFKWK